MRVLIAADMEGISGVVHWDHVKPGHFEYVRFREIMTEEVNAAIDGALDGGASSVTVADGSARMMERQCRSSSGTHSPPSTPWRSSL